MNDRSKSKAPPKSASGTDDKASAPAEGERIAKVIARSGLCSRRDAESWIVAGRVTVNGVVLSSPALNVRATDVILVDGKPITQPDRTRLWRYHKPNGLVTTHRDPEGRATVFDQLPSTLPRVISIGRLDITSEGLLLLTNDGELARRLELPSTAWTRRYRVRAYGKVDQPALDSLAKGVIIDEVKYGPIEAKLERQQRDNTWLTMVLREGKNREVRKVLEHLGLTVNRLIRVSYGPFQLGDLERGAVEEIPGKVLRDQLGQKLAEGLTGLDRQPPSAAQKSEAARKPDTKSARSSAKKPGRIPKPDRPRRSEDAHRRR